MADASVVSVTSVPAPNSASSSAAAPEPVNAPEPSFVEKTENLVNKVAHFLHKSAVYASEGFVALFGAPQAQAFGHAAIGLLQTEAGKVALSVCSALESVSPALSGATKHGQAFENIKSQLGSSGKVVEAGIINLLIEVAVTAISGKIKLPS